MKSDLTHEDRVRIRDIVDALRRCGQPTTPVLISVQFLHETGRVVYVEAKDAAPPSRTSREK